MAKAGKGRTTVYNKIVTEEVLAKVNKKNIELNDAYLEYLKSNGCTESTIYQYNNNLKIFWCWNYEYNKDVHFTKMKKKDFIKLQAHAKTVWGWSPKRIRTFKATLSSLSDYIFTILDEEYKRFKPIVNSIPNVSDDTVRKKVGFTARELQKILDKLEENGEYYAACVLSVAMNSGRSKGELPRFKVEYFNKSNLICEGALYKTPEKIFGKGSSGKITEAYILAKPVQKYLDLWLGQRRELGIHSRWLFPNFYKGKWRNEPISTSMLNNLAKKYTEIAGKHFYWTSMKDYLANYLSDSNIPYTIIDAMLGSDSYNIARACEDSIDEKQLEKFFGADGIKQVSRANITEL